jgi:hypothetical protein
LGLVFAGQQRRRDVWLPARSLLIGPWGPETTSLPRTLRNAVAALLESLPDDLKDEHGAKLLGSIADRKVYNMVHLISGQELRGKLKRLWVLALEHGGSLARRLPRHGADAAPSLLRSATPRSLNSPNEAIMERPHLAQSGHWWIGQCQLNAKSRQLSTIGILPRIGIRKDLHGGVRPTYAGSQFGCQLGH